MKSKFKPHQKVKKRAGYPYPGTIVSVFEVWPETDEPPIWRYVVRCDIPEVEGMLHIYSENQLELVEDEDGCTRQEQRSAY